MLIAAADVGSVPKHKFAWFAADGDGNRRGGELNHEDPAGLAECVRTSLDAGEPVALGFECPLALPVPDNSQDLGRQRLQEGQHTWSSAAARRGGVSERHRPTELGASRTASNRDHRAFLEVAS